MSESTKAGRTDFVEHVANAYEHLYDSVYLRTHHLTDLLVPDQRLRRKEKAWELHRILIAVIDELDPGMQAPVFSREWRRHSLMVLRYVDGLDPQSVADELNISRRHFYREQQPAFEAIAGILWNRYIVEPAHTPKDGADGESNQSTDRLELLREEVARMNRADGSSSLQMIVPGVHAILADTMKARSLDVSLHIPQDLPGIVVDPGLLRQVIMAVLGCLVEHSEHAQIQLRAQAQEPSVEMSITIEPLSGLSLSAPMLDERLSTLGELALLGQCSIEAVHSDDGFAGFRLSLPMKAQPTILVVDDNDDALELFRRYLGDDTYRVVTARSAREALALARRLQPHTILLDLMMPGQDGWDVLQTLRHQTETHHIPIIICSVLRQSELAHMLGANAFLEKPVSEQALLEVLVALERR